MKAIPVWKGYNFTFSLTNIYFSFIIAGGFVTGSNSLDKLDFPFVQAFKYLILIVQYSLSGKQVQNEISISKIKKKFMTNACLLLV